MSAGYFYVPYIPLHYTSVVPEEIALFMCIDCEYTERYIYTNCIGIECIMCDENKLMKIGEEE